MKTGLLKPILTYVGIALFFLILSYAFVFPVLQGKIVDQSDINSWQGMVREASVYNSQHPEDKTFWTNSMFGGMPTVAMMDNFDGDITKAIYSLLLTGKRPATYLFIGLVGAFLLLMSAGCRKWIAVAGAIAMTFCSYNLQIIQVGHNTKMQAIAFFPWVLAAVIFTLRSVQSEKWIPRTLAGASLFGLALSLQIKANHPQITYYLAIVIFLYALTLVVWYLADKGRRTFIPRLAIIGGALLVSGMLGIATNANKLLPTYEYAKYTMRGGSELKAEDGSAGNSKGLDLDYATAWSYGINETPNLLIPNYNGGASIGGIPKDGATAQTLKRYGYKGRQLDDTLSRLPVYYGPQPFTAGPMYMGAISVFLFILGMMLYKGKEKWWMLACVIICIFLAWGRNFMPWTKLWYDLAPMYNKFRTVSMALVTLQILLPLLGFVTIDRALRQEYDSRQTRRKASIALGITGGFCLLAIAFPAISGGFSTSYDPQGLEDALASDRVSLLRADALRSLLFIAAAYLVVLFSTLSVKMREKTDIFAPAILCALVVLDLFPVGRRYLNESHFITPKQNRTQWEMRPVDKFILAENDLYSRVLDLSVNTFNDAHQCYHHKCIGGYSPVKMQRYQDLIDRYISKEMGRIGASLQSCDTFADAQAAIDKVDMPIISALNGKYVIIAGDGVPLVNHKAMGNCWLVENVEKVSTPDDEISALSKTNLAKTAIIGCDFADNVEKIAQNAEKIAQNVEPAAQNAEKISQNSAAGKDAAAAVSSTTATRHTDRIELISYSPKTLVYTYDCSRERLAVFSDIFYPGGWIASDSNGNDIEVLRADWILRAAVIPEGKGEITFTFDMPSIRTGRNISTASSILLILLLIGSGAVCVLRKASSRCSREQ